MPPSRVQSVPVPVPVSYPCTSYFVLRTSYFVRVMSCRSMARRRSRAIEMMNVLQTQAEARLVAANQHQRTPYTDAEESDRRRTRKQPQCQRQYCLRSPRKPEPCLISPALSHRLGTRPSAAHPLIWCLLVFEITPQECGTSVLTDQIKSALRTYLSSETVLSSKRRDAPGGGGVVPGVASLTSAAFPMVEGGPAAHPWMRSGVDPAILDLLCVEQQAWRSWSNSADSRRWNISFPLLGQRRKRSEGPPPSQPTTQRRAVLCLV